MAATRHSYIDPRVPLEPGARLTRKRALAILTTARDFCNLGARLHEEGMTLARPFRAAEVLVKARRLWRGLTSTIVPEHDGNGGDLPGREVTRGSVTYRVHGIVHTACSPPVSSSASSQAPAERREPWGFLRRQTKMWEQAGESYLCEQGLAGSLGVGHEREIRDYWSLADSYPEAPIFRDFDYAGALAMLTTQLSSLGGKPGYVGLAFSEDPEVSSPANRQKCRLADAFSRVRDGASLAAARALYSRLTLPAPLGLAHRQFVLDAVRSEFPTWRHDPGAYGLLFYWTSPARNRQIAECVLERSRDVRSGTVHVVTGLAHEWPVAWYLANL